MRHQVVNVAIRPLIFGFLGPVKIAVGTVPTILMASLRHEWPESKDTAIVAVREFLSTGQFRAGFFPIFLALFSRHSRMDRQARVRGTHGFQGKKMVMLRRERKPDLAHGWWPMPDIAGETAHLLDRLRLGEDQARNDLIAHAF